MRLVFKAALVTENNELKLYTPAYLELDEDFQVVSYGKHTGETPDLDLSKYVLLPKLVNGHVHVLDLELRKYFHSYYIDDVVGAPYGIKYRYLDKTPPEELAESVEYAFTQMRRTGTGLALVVVEYGLKFHKLVEECAERAGVEVRLFLEPSYFRILPEGEEVSDELVQEVEQILELGHDVELVSPLNYTRAELRQIAELVHGSGRLVMTHVSETEDTHSEGDLDLAVHDLNADLLVHCCFLEPHEVDLLRDRIVVVTPRSNLTLIRKLAPLHEILRRDVVQGLLIGTDNVGLCNPDIWQELRALAEVLQNRNLLVEVLMKYFLTCSRMSSRACIRQGTVLTGQILETVSTGESIREFLLGLVKPEVRVVGEIQDGIVQLFKEN